MAKAHTLTDNFNDNSRSPQWSSYGQIVEVNERVEVRPPPNQQGDNNAEYISVDTYDLTDSSVHVGVLQLLRPVHSSNAWLWAAKDGEDTRLVLECYEGNMQCSYWLGGVRTQLTEQPYDPVAHRVWRIRESKGTTWWEASPDGEHWTVLFSAPNPLPTATLYGLKLRFGAGTFISIPGSVGIAAFDSFNLPLSTPSRRVQERRLSAEELREQAAELAAGRVHPEHANNNDEVNYPERPFIGSYSKSLRHDSLGDPEPISYGTLLRAMQSRDPGDFEEVILASPTAKKLTNPQAGLAFELEGPDAQAVTMPPAPRFDSAQTAAEMGELYWMALARDIPFSEYDNQLSDPNSVISRAIQSLNNEFPSFGGTVPVTDKNLFRGIFPGEQVGPYVSQFLLKGNIDPRKPDGQGRDALEGFIIYGSQVIDQRQWTVKGFPAVGAAADYLTGFNDWLAVQNGRDDRGQDQLDTSQRLFIRNLRDGANYVHFDQVVNAFWNAAFYLLSEPHGNQDLGSIPGTGRPQVDLEFPKNAGNPYDPPGTAGDSRTQVGFATFGPIHLLQALIEVAGRAGRAVWWQKWGVHRRLRPEEYGGRVDNQLNNRRTYPLHASITTSLSTGGLAPYFPERYGSYLLPQAYPEGAPTHPAYGAGHATIAGACATLLKAFFDENKLIENPVRAGTSGTFLAHYTEADAAQLTVGGELNKLAGNIALFRNAAGVHWRTDYSESLPLGEAVAIGLLQEMSLTFNEDDAFFQFTRFDGKKLRIQKGVVRRVPA